MRNCHLAIGGGMLFLALCLHTTPATGQTRSDSVCDGTFVKAEGDELRMKRFSDQREYPPFKIRRTVKVTLNGQVSKLGDLRAGDTLRVTVQNEKGTTNREIFQIEARRPR